MNSGIERNTIRWHRWWSGMRELHKRSPRTPQKQEMVKRGIESTDGRIDRLVYEMYGLNEEEIKFIEGK